MQEYKYAGIDIGSNAMRLLINTVIPAKTYDDAIMNKLVYLRLPIRLGDEVFKNGIISPMKTELFLNGLSIFKQLIDFYEIKNYRACATSATRSALNAKQVTEEIKKKIGLTIDVIDGTEEAMLLFKTNIYNLPEGKTFLSADLGGGSLQLTLFENKKLIWTHSYDIGTVRQLENVISNTEILDFESKIKEISSTYKDVKIIGSGGNINKIASILNKKNVLYTDLKDLYDNLKPLSILERMKKYSFRLDRADVILPATEIYIKLLKLSNKKSIYVPKIGLSDGIIRELYEKYH